MGAGKTTVGRALAARLGHERYVDNDAAVAALAGEATVALARRGGESLHHWESRYARTLTTLDPPFVAGIAASTADQEGDLTALREAGLLVYLRCDVATLLDRVRRDPPRPWLDGEPGALLEEMYARRDPVLRAAAELVVDGSAPVGDTVERITRRLGVGAT